MTKIASIIKPIESTNNFQNQKLSNQLKHNLIELIALSTVHALPRLVTSRLKINRILWAIFLILSTSVGVYFVYKNLIEYLDYNTVTVYQITEEDQAQFPTVSICSANGFQRDSLDEILASCYFNADFSCMEKKKDYFDTFDDDAYGLCFRFNSGDKSASLLKSAFSGPRFGLNLIFKNLSSLDEKIIVNIHNHTISPATLFNKETYVTIGSHAEFSVIRSYIQYLPLPYNNCYKDLRTYSFNKTYIDLILNDNRSYTQKECLELCSLQYFIDHSGCGCNVPLRSIQVLCFLKANLTMRVCLFKFLENNLKNSKMYSMCIDFCPLECDSSDFKIERYSSYLFNNSLTKITVFYENFKYTVIAQQPKNLLIDLIPNIGGILGLFIGTSFLSFVEIVEILIQIIYIILKSKKSK